VVTLNACFAEADTSLLGNITIKQVLDQIPTGFPHLLHFGSY